MDIIAHNFLLFHVTTCKTIFKYCPTSHTSLVKLVKTHLIFIVGNHDSTITAFRLLIASDDKSSSHSSNITRCFVRVQLVQYVTLFLRPCFLTHTHTFGACSFNKRWNWLLKQYFIMQFTEIPFWNFSDWHTSKYL